MGIVRTKSNKNIMINFIVAISLLLSPLTSFASLPYGVTAEGFNEETLKSELWPLAEKLSEITGIDEYYVLNEVFGELHFRQVVYDTGWNYNCYASLVCYGPYDFLTNPLAKGLLVHELGHIFLNNAGVVWEDMAYSLGYYEGDTYIHVSGLNPETNRFERTPRGYPLQGAPYEQHGCLSPYYHTYQEDFADMFMNWALDGFSDDEAGRLRYEFMDNFVRNKISLSTNLLINKHPCVQMPIRKEDLQ